MSRSTESEAVPFKATVWIGEGCWVERDNAPEFLLKQIDHEESLTVQPRPWTHNGWTGTWGLQKYGCIYVTTFEKDDMTVYFVNESDCANGGSITATYFADKRKHLETFLKDNYPERLTPTIANSTVQQTL